MKAAYIEVYVVVGDKYWSLAIGPQGTRGVRDLVRISHPSEFTPSPLDTFLSLSDWSSLLNVLKCLLPR